MYTVTVRAPDGAEASYPLGKDQGLIVGRDETCDIVLPSKRVSRRHARFFTDGERLHIEDLGSQNGVFVGGARVSGTNEVRPGPAIEIGEFKIRIRKADPRAIEAAGSVDVNVSAEGLFKGLGEMAGKELKLPPERGYVGRDADRELPIDNDSVSRKHAEVRLEAGMVHVVVDLASSNGTFVNGERLKPNLPCRLKHGDKVRFGETHWQYLAGGGAGGAKAALSSKAKLGIAAAAVLVVLFAVLGLARRPHPVTRDLGDGDPTMSADDLVAQGQQAMNEERFGDARAAFQKVVDQNPLSDKARLLVRQAEKELRDQRLFNDASGKADLGRDNEALKLFVQIDTDSRFFARARLKVQQLSTGVMKRESVRCRDAARRREAKTALEACSRYLDYQCQLGSPDDDALKALRQAEKATHDHTAWVCPPGLAVWFGSGERRTGDASEVLARRYPDKDVQEAMAAYLKGDLVNAQHLMDKAKGKNSVAADLAEQLSIIAARYKEGDADSRAGNSRDMKEAFDLALAADAKIVPDGLTSFSARDMRSRIASALSDQGDSLYSQQSLSQAYDTWRSALGYDPSNAQVLAGMNRLEKKAGDILDSSPGCGDIRLAEHITGDQTAVHERAVQLFDKRGCR